jgi:hypothetical protein
MINNAIKLMHNAWQATPTIQFIDSLNMLAYKIQPCYMFTIWDIHVYNEKWSTESLHA